MNKYFTLPIILLCILSSCHSNVDYRYYWFTQTMCSEEYQVFIPVDVNGKDAIFCGSINVLYSIVNPEMTEDKFRKSLYKLSKENSPLHITEEEFGLIDESYFVVRSETVRYIYRTLGVDGLKDEVTKYNEGSSSLSHDELMEVLYLLWENNIYLIWALDEYPNIILTVTE